MSEMTLTLRPQDDVSCRACGVHCDKVIYPSACVERSCPFVYAYNEHARMQPASLAKMMTFYLTLEALRQKRVAILAAETDPLASRKSR